MFCVQFLLTINIFPSTSSYRADTRRHSRQGTAATPMIERQHSMRFAATPSSSPYDFDTGRISPPPTYQRYNMPPAPTPPLSPPPTPPAKMRHTAGSERTITEMIGEVAELLSTVLGRLQASNINRSHYQSQTQMPDLLA